MLTLPTPFKRSDGRWAAKFRSPDGHYVVYLGRADEPDQEKLRQAAIRWLENQAPIAAPVPVPEPEPEADPEAARYRGWSWTVRELVAWFHDEHVPEAYTKKFGDEGVRLTSEAARLRSALRWLEDVVGDVVARELSLDNLKAVRNAMWTAKTDDGSPRFTRKSVNAYVSAIGVLYGAACNDDDPVLPPEPMAPIKALEPLKARGKYKGRERDDVQHCDLDDLKDVLDAAPAVIRDMAIVQVCTGMRPGEVVLMRPCDIVEGEKGTLIFEPMFHKTDHHHGKERKVVLFPDERLPEALRFGGSELTGERSAMDIVRERIAALGLNRKGFLFTPGEALAEIGRKPTIARERWHVDTYRKALNRSADAAGAERIAPNRLRHTFATIAEDHFGPVLKSVLMGHSTLQMTENYTHRSVEDAIAKVV